MVNKQNVAHYWSNDHTVKEKRKTPPETIMYAVTKIEFKQEVRGEKSVRW